jgi:hypothetical protein
MQDTDHHNLIDELTDLRAKRAKAVKKFDIMDCEAEIRRKIFEIKESRINTRIKINERPKKEKRKIKRKKRSISQIIKNLVNENT